MKFKEGPKNFERNKKRGVDRSKRRFVKLIFGGLLGGGILLGLICNPRGRHKKEKVEKLSLEEFLSKINKKLLSIENNNEKIDYSKIEKELKEFLKDKKISKLVEIYFEEYEKGLEEGVIDNLWEEKINLLERRNITEKISETRKFKQLLMDEYEDLPKGYIKDLKQFKSYLKLCVFETLNVLNFESLLTHKRFNFEEEKRNLIIKIFRDNKFLNCFTNLLLALMLNEICHISTDKEINKKLLEYLLRKYGLRFICSIPSIYDVVPSFGPFQLSYFVIGKEENKFYPINFMNQFIKEFDKELKEKYNLPDYKLPEEVYELRLREHFRAEILLLLFYLLEILKELDITTINRCLEKPEWFYKQLIYYLGGSHHLPNLSQELFIEFLNQEKSIEYEKGFVDFVETKFKEGDLLAYLKKLKENLD